ncbi:MAG: type III pantothenate kinase [Bacteroidales bacterium]|jgi:type III pantothenate kinase|nr:type III pantothenate kinase [Bacteroidales bacterium]
MDLIIDVGNNRQKVAVFDAAGEMVAMQIYKSLNMEDIIDIFYVYNIRRSILSSVIGCNVELERFLQLSSEYHRFTHNSKLPVQLCYATPQTLGLDRIACAVAAHQLYDHHSSLIVQAGTCLVFDFIDSDGNYYGGSISPGLNMRLAALHQHTANLPLIPLEKIDYFLGRTTQQSIKSGVINGTIYEIEGFIKNYQSRYNGLKVLITGGDGEFLQKSVKDSIFVGSNFVLKGLHKILQLNAEYILA